MFKQSTLVDEETTDRYRDVHSKQTFGPRSIILVDVSILNKNKEVRLSNFSESLISLTFNIKVTFRNLAALCNRFNTAEIRKTSFLGVDK